MSKNVEVMMDSDAMLVAVLTAFKGVAESGMCSVVQLGQVNGYSFELMCFNEEEPGTTQMVLPVDDPAIYTQLNLRFH